MESQNHSQYKDKEFVAWAYRDQLLPDEQFLIDDFLSRERSTLEAGTGGGCILHTLRKSGFTQLHGFDFLSAFIRVARERDESRAIKFIVADATALPYADHSFEQAIYLQQLLCMIEDTEKRETAMAELSRVLKPGGAALFSFLCYEAREQQLEYKLFLTYLKTFRVLFRRSTTAQLQPWLRHRNRPNLLALLDRPPYVYWYRIHEAVDLLERHGFVVVAAASEKEALAQQTVSPAALRGEEVTGMLYLVARKEKRDRTNTVSTFADESRSFAENNPVRLSSRRF